MRGKRYFLLTVALSIALPAVAHHSLEAQYDPNHTITINGTLTKIDWSNPHVHFLVDVMGPGQSGTWDVEMGSPNAQLRGGWKIDTFKPGAALRARIAPLCSSMARRAMERPRPTPPLARARSDSTR